MNTFKKSILLFGALITAPLANASHHFEAEEYLQDSRVAQVDNFIFQSAKKDHTAVVMTVNYAPKEGENKTFNSDAIYNMHFSSGLDLASGKTLSIKFDKNNYAVYEIDTPNPQPGALGKKIGTGTIGEKNNLTKNIQSYAGIVEDPFYGNALALEVFRKEIVKGSYQYNPDIWGSVKGKNVFKERKVGAIVLDLPNSMLGKEVFAFFTTDLKVNNQWKQVQYSAIPLFSHVMLFDNTALRQAHDASRPTQAYNDGTRPVVAANILRAITSAGSKDKPLQYADETSKTLVADVLHYQVGTPASFSADKINGRSIDDDSMSVILTLLLGQNTDQAIENTKKYTKEFPYVIPTESK